MLRTLAYQCIEKDKDARTVLEKLKSKGFQITDNLGIGYLFEKLLLDPLRDTPEIYIILDGLDEADMITQDHTDRTGRPEMHVLSNMLLQSFHQLGYCASAGQSQRSQTSLKIRSLNQSAKMIMRRTLTHTSKRL